MVDHHKQLHKQFLKHLAKTLNYRPQKKTKEEKEESRVKVDAKVSGNACARSNVLIPL